MDRAWLNGINQEKRIDPERALRSLRSVQLAPALQELGPNVKNLRTNGLKRHREIRQACLFCFGMSQKIGQTVWVYPIEDADFDFVAGWEVDKKRHFAPTQLKELVPDELNPKATLQTIVDGLVKYPQSENLTVAVHLNKSKRFDPNQIVFPKLNIAALWVFGSTSEDQSEWFCMVICLNKRPTLFLTIPSKLVVD
jgi:hypothetical protein